MRGARPRPRPGARPLGRGGAGRGEAGGTRLSGRPLRRFLAGGGGVNAGPLGRCLGRPLQPVPRGWARWAAASSFRSTGYLRLR